MIRRHPVYRLGAALALLLGSIVAAAPTHAGDAEDDLGTWLGASSTLRFSDKWSLFLQGEVRTWEMLSNLNELLFRAGGHYELGKRYMVGFGYVRVDTWPYSDSRYHMFYENRSYQDFVIRSNWGKGRAVQRFRLEQRWITTDVYGTEYSNRIRYMLGYTHPLKGGALDPGTSFFRVSNEVFVDLGRGDYWFDLEEIEAGLNQNRLWVGGGHQFSALSNLQIGLQWQHRPEVDFLRLVVWYTRNFDFRASADDR